MHTNDFVVDHRTARERVESIAKVLPHLYREPATTFVVKSVDSINARTFMVSSQKEEVFWIFNLVCKQETNNFQ